MDAGKAVRAENSKMRGVVTRWTGVNMSTPLCPQDVPEIDADPPSLDSGCVMGIGTACPETLPQLEEDALSPHSTDIVLVRPTLLDLALLATSLSKTRSHPEMIGNTSGVTLQL